jgi:MORN repeat
MQYADGSFYEGEFGCGERVKGKFVSGDGSVDYTGGWKQDTFHGYGVLHSRGNFKYMGVSVCLVNHSIALLVWPSIHVQ